MGNVLHRLQRRMGKPMRSKLLKRSYRRSIAQAPRAVRLLTVLTMLLGILAPLAGTSPAHATSTPSNAAQASTARILVKFKASASASDIASAIKNNGGQDERDLKQLRIHVIDVPAAARDSVLAAFAHHPSVERADPGVQL